MILNIVLISISILMFIIIARNRNNTYVWIFAGAFLSLNIILISMIFYVIKLSNYYSVFSIENSIIMTLSKLNVDFFHIHMLVNAGVVLFMTSKISLFSVCALSSKRKYRIIVSALFFVAASLYMYFNSTVFMQSLYIMRNSGDSVRTGELMRTVAKTYNIALLSIVCILPYIAIIYNYSHTTLSFKKKQFLILAMFLAILDIFFFTVFVFGGWKGKIINNIDLEMLTHYGSAQTNNGFVYLSLIALVIINVVYVLLAKYRVFDSVTLFKNRVMLKNIKLLPTDIRTVTHSSKNAVFAIKAICDAIKEEHGGDEHLNSLIDQIDAVSTDVLDHLETFANLTNSDINRFSETEIQSCIEEAVSKLYCKDIRIEKNYDSKPVYILAARKEMVEALYNVLVNSVEAITLSGKSNGTIKISLYSDTEWVCVSVWDNGCGIKGKDIKKLYNPLFSTKKTNKNWGIGLSYTYKVVKAHLGIIFCKSVYGSYTEFQILMPRLHEGGSSIW